jgi:hypothetical protein
MPSAAYRFFQPITVGFDTPTRSTISLTDTPSAASNTIRARRARPAEVCLKKCTSWGSKYPATGGDLRVILSKLSSGGNPCFVGCA